MSELQTLYRILDASANRAAEGLRTLEEFARFVLRDSSLAGQLKSLRHQLAGELSRLSREQLLLSRDTAADVGTTLRESAEYTRLEISDVIRAASSRVQQSMRVLEEYGKLIDVSMAQQIEQLRYESYRIGAELELLAPRAELLSRLYAAQLYVLIDGGHDERSFEHSVRQLAASAVDILQLRDHGLDDRTLLNRARLAVRIARDHGKILIVNDRADIAVAADADGVHVGQEELPAVDARRIVGAKRLIGVSTHSIEQAREAVRDGADYIGCGPVFPSRTKRFDAFVGTVLLQRVADEIALPAFAIGGIDAENVRDVIAAGFQRIAVTGAIRDATEPATAAEMLRRMLPAIPPAAEWSLGISDR
jgi:thiamine-phosphate pyrophosphorylase